MYILYIKSLENNLSLDSIHIRTELRPGDIGYITYLHVKHYKEEYNYGTAFELRVASGLIEFCELYNPANNRIWICEHENKIIGSLLLLNRGETAQLRFFFISPGYRSVGLGTKLMDLYMEFFHQCGYASSYLWTTHELHAAANLYKKYGFRLVEEKPSVAFGKPVTEQRYVLEK